MLSTSTTAANCEHLWAAPIIIAGMHRSGTSFLTSMLQRAGLNIGERLMPADPDNRRGHFENSDFVAFHQSVLLSQEFNEDGWTLKQRLPVPERLHQTAINLLKTNEQAPHWGWKDPRSTLFLDFWSQIAPESNFVLIARAPWEVADSLFRRGDQVFQEDPSFALEVWHAYNLALADFYERKSDRCILVLLPELINQPEQVLERINQKFGIKLTSTIATTFADNMLRTQIDACHIATIKSFFPNVSKLWQHLEEITGISEERYVEEGYSKLALAQWRNSSLHQRRLQEQLTDTTAQLHKSQQERLRSGRELASTRMDLKAALCLLGQTRASNVN